jgi:hypothetical protein
MTILRQENPMTKRLMKFHSLKTHAWFSRVYKKLSADDIKFCEQFISQYDALNKDDFEFTINRAFLDKAEKPTRWTLMIELLANANV